jgi:membrane protein implicated in regulation of membrane protease activity
MSLFLLYATCLGLGLVFVVFSLIAGHFFGGHDTHVAGSGGHAEAGADSSDAPGVSTFSPTVIASFVTTFGALGLILTQIERTKNAWVNAPLALAGAFGVAAIILWVLRKLIASTQSSSEAQVGHLVGSEATVITPIPLEGVGEIAYVISGTRYTGAARSENGGSVPAGATVRISRSTGTQFYVTPI